MAIHDHSSRDFGGSDAGRLGRDVPEAADPPRVGARPGICEFVRGAARAGAGFRHGIPQGRPHHDREGRGRSQRSEEHTSELQSQSNLVCRLLLEKKKKPPDYATAARLSVLFPVPGRPAIMISMVLRVSGRKVQYLAITPLLCHTEDLQVRGLYMC